MRLSRGRAREHDEESGAGDEAERERDPQVAPLEDPTPRVEAAARVSVQGATCPLCHEGLTARPRLEVCPVCHTIHHSECVAEMGRCATLGCTGLRGERAAPVLPNEQTLATLTHLLGAFGGGVVVPLLVFALTRNKPQHRFAHHHAKQALLFCLLTIPLSITIVWIPIALALMIRAAMRAHRFEWDAYPVLGKRLAPADALPPPPTKPKEPKAPA